MKALHPSKAFSLLEMLVAVFLIGIAAALIVPKFMELRRNALIQIAKEQTASIQTSLNTWMASYTTPAQARDAFGTATTLSAWPTGLQALIDSRTVSDFTFVSGTPSYLTTSVMRKVTKQTGESFVAAASGTASTSLTFAGTAYSLSANGSAQYPHVIIYWPADTNNLRLRSQPVAVLFIPQK